MYRMPIPGDLEIGYYTLELLNAGITVDRGLLVIAPDHAYVADQSEESEIGVTLQLYSIHSSRSLGAGDFRDLLERNPETRENVMRLIAERQIENITSARDAAFPDGSVRGVDTHGPLSCIAPGRCERRHGLVLQGT